MMSHVSRDGYGDKRKSGSDSKFDFNRFELYSALITWSTSKENRSESRSLSTQSEGAIFFRSRFSSDMYKDTYLNCYILLLHIIYILYLHITVYFPNIYRPANADIENFGLYRPNNFSKVRSTKLRKT